MSVQSVHKFTLVQNSRINVRNKFKSICDKCWKKVPPDGGEVAKIHGRWITRHDACVNLEADSLLRATLARQGDEVLSNEVHVDMYDTSQMNLKFVRENYGN